MRLAAALLLAALLVLGLLWLFARATGIGPASPELPHATSGAESGPSEAAGGTARSSEEHVVVRGRLVDASGVAWVDLPIRAAGREARTRADGTFELGGLERAEHALELTSAFDPAEPLGERRLACSVPPLALDLRAVTGDLDVGTQVVPRSKPYWIEGTVELDLAWTAPKGLTFSNVRIDLIEAAPEDLGPLYEAERAPLPGSAVDWTRPPWRSELPPSPPLTAEGHFRFAVETPHMPFLLRLQLGRTEPVERLLVPTPDGHFAETFLLP